MKQMNDFTSPDGEQCKNSVCIYYKSYEQVNIIQFIFDIMKLLS